MPKGFYHIDTLFRTSDIYDFRSRESTKCPQFVSFGLSCDPFFFVKCFKELNFATIVALTIFIIWDNVWGRNFSLDNAIVDAQVVRICFQ